MHMHMQVERCKQNKTKQKETVESLTLRNQFYSRLGARAKSKTVDGPMATGKCNIVNMIHAMYSLQLQEDIDRILVHRMQHNNKVLSVEKEKRERKREREKRIESEMQNYRNIFL